MLAGLAYNVAGLTPMVGDYYIRGVVGVLRHDARQPDIPPMPPPPVDLVARFQAVAARGDVWRPW
jgi:hypothetical protein